MPMTPEAKKELGKTIRDLRERLLADLRAATESTYRLGVKQLSNAGLSDSARKRRQLLQNWIAEQLRTQGLAEAGATEPKASGEGGKAKAGKGKAAKGTAAKGRSAGKLKPGRSAEDFLREAEQQAAYTLLNRLVILRLLETPPTAADPSGSGADGGRSGSGGGRVSGGAHEEGGGGGGASANKPAREPALVTGGWESRAYKDFRQLAPALVRQDDTEGYGFLLQLAFQDLAHELPGVFGAASLFGAGGVADLIPVSAGTLRHVVDQLNQPELDSCWGDDMTLGWIYQYWNDPSREALDAKLNAGGKVEPHEIASKTQMFTERYMVDWLLQNSLGPMWLAMCQKHGWTPDLLNAQGGQSLLQRLEARRADWRVKREAGEVQLTDLMPLESALEQRWAYYVPQPIPQAAVEQAPDSLRELRLLDPAVGSGHFLVVALELLFHLYREEARLRGEAPGRKGSAGQGGAGESDGPWTDTAIVERILSHNLSGIDLDPRAVQIAAAALWLKAQQLAPGARPSAFNLVASNLRLASLPETDPALLELKREVQREIGLPGELTDSVISALRGADHLGSLLKVDAAVDEALQRHEAVLGKAKAAQGDLFEGHAAPEVDLLDHMQAKQSLLSRLERFLGAHTGSDDLGLRLAGEQLASGVRFLRLVREGSYDLVVANPPYQGTSKMADARYVEDTYPLGKADLYAAFLLRGLELVREGGVSAMLTMRNWMFIKQYSGLREHLLASYDIRALGDFAVGAFDEVPNDVLSVTVSTFHRAPQRPEASVALQPTPPDDKSYDRDRTRRKRAATLCHVGRHEFDPAALQVVPEWPLVYWWDEEMLRLYQSAPLIGTTSPGKVGMTSSNGARFTRKAWEPQHRSVSWSPFINGAEGKAWCEPMAQVALWQHHGLAIKSFTGFLYGSHSRQVRSEELYFRKGVAFSMIGAAFTARGHRYASIFGDKGSSIFPPSLGAAVCALNSSRGRQILSALNPSISFQVGDVNRLPLFPISGADEIFAQIEAAFSIHESHREPSVEFKQPGPSPWRHAQDWAQLAVDRPAETPLPAYVEELDPEPPTDHLSFALGVALGRFAADGSGILDPASADLSHALPGGLLFLDDTLDPEDHRDSLGHPAAAPLLAAWKAHGAAIDTKRKSLREWLALDFFALHKSLYENRPIHWPLSSANKTFVAWVNIHRMTEGTLRLLLADHLYPTATRIAGELSDLGEARDGADKQAARSAEKRYESLKKASVELSQFIASVEQCADRGAPPVDARATPRAQDSRYAPDLDDGVMINSAALWPLLEPQWKDPKKWWKELSSPSGRKDYDWAHLALRYWPQRVDKKCQADPSLGVAHGCFWRYHPERAWSWELRLQDEIGPDFVLTEPPYAPPGLELTARAPDGGDAAHRAAYLAQDPEQALQAVEKEATRRMGRSKQRKLVPEMKLLFPGLWSALPEACWQLELNLAEKQGADFLLLAPDEPKARAAYLKANPELAKARAALLASLKPPADLFPDEAEAADDPDPESADEQDAT